MLLKGSSLSHFLSLSRPLRDDEKKKERKYRENKLPNWPRYQPRSIFLHARARELPHLGAKWRCFGGFLKRETRWSGSVNAGYTRRRERRVISYASERASERGRIHYARYARANMLWRTNVSGTNPTLLAATTSIPFLRQVSNMIYGNSEIQLARPGLLIRETDYEPIIVAARG